MSILEMLVQIGIPDKLAMVILFVLFLTAVWAAIKIGSMPPKEEKNQTNPAAFGSAASQTASSAPVAAISAAVNEYRKNHN